MNMRCHEFVWLVKASTILSNYFTLSKHFKHGITWFYQLLYKWVLKRSDHECKFVSKWKLAIEKLFKVHISGFHIQNNKAYALVT